MVISGIVLLVVAAIWILYKIYISYNSAGGTAYQVPVYDAAIYPPILTSVGLFLITRGSGVSWSIWVFVGVTLGLALVIIAAVKICEEIGDSPLR